MVGRSVDRTYARHFHTPGDVALEVVGLSADNGIADVNLTVRAGELYALRHDIPVRGAQSTPVVGWVERLDPETLAVTASTPRLPGGPYWPGGIAAHSNGDLHMVFGHWAHRLTPGLEVLASHRLPVDRPHNSFVALDGGELVTKDCDAPAGREPSTVSVLDPESGDEIVRLHPSLNLYPASSEPIGTPSIRMGTPFNGLVDLYASL